MAPFFQYLVGSTAFVSSPVAFKANPYSSMRHHLHLHDDTSIEANKATHSASNDRNKQHDLSRLVKLLGGSPTNLLRLSSSDEGIRGVYLNEEVQTGDVILKMPMSSVLRDDEPPSWLIHEKLEDEDDEHQAIENQDWVTRLAASLLEAQKNTNQMPEGIREWLGLLPESLRDNLPVYWSEEAIRSTDCRPLELAVDSAFFARAGPLFDLSLSNMTTEEIEQAVDLVQTRACRSSVLTLPDGDISKDREDQSNTDLRVLVPVFDMINHSYEPNSEFFRQGDFMVVRAIQDIEKDSEVFIHYGSSTMPVWKCLFSYGFVPSVEDIYEHFTAEIVVDDYRFQVTPKEIPFELVQYQAKKLGCDNDDPETIEFTPEIGLSIVDELVNYAKTLERYDQERKNQSKVSQTTHYLIESLRESHRKTLLACARGLLEYAEEQQ